MDIRGTKLFQRLHEWLAGEPVYKFMREDRDSLMEDMRVIADAICGKPDMRPGELLLKISDLKAEAAFGRGCLEHGHALGIDPTKEVGQQYRALRRDAEAWRKHFGVGHGPGMNNADRVTIRFQFKDKDDRTVLVKDTEVLLEDSARGCPPPQQEGLVGMMIHIPAKMFLNKRVREAYVDGYIAGKGET
mgnify:CR=1 FL=1